MALGIMIAGILAAVFGTTLAIAMGFNLSSVLIVYGIFGICGGIFACRASISMPRTAACSKSPHHRTLG